MGILQEIKKPAKNGGINWILLGLLLTFTLISSLYIVRSKDITGIFVLAGLIGAAVGVFILIYPKFGFYLTIFMSFFIFDLIRLFNTEAPIVSSVDIVILMTFLGVLLNKAIKKEKMWHSKPSPIVLCYFGLIMYSLIELFNPNGGSLQLSLLLLRRYFTLLLFLYNALNFFREVKDIRFFIFFWLGCSMANALYACYEEWHGLPKFELDYILADPLRERLSSLDNGNYRKSSFLSGSTDFGLVMAASAPMVLSALLGLKKKLIVKVGLFLALVFYVLGMSYSGTRTAILMLLVSIVLYVLMTMERPGTLAFSVVFSLIFAFIIFGPIYGNGTINRVRSSFDFDKEESLKVRDVNRHRIQPYIYTHPIGGGLGTTGVMTFQYNPNHPLAGFPTDSGLLKYALEYGWIGLLLQCITYFIILQQGIHAYFRSRNPNYRVIYMACVLPLFGYICAQYSQIAIGQIPGGLLYFGLIAVIIRMRNIEQAEQLELSTTKAKLSAIKAN